MRQTPRWNLSILTSWIPWRSAWIDRGKNNALGWCRIYGQWCPKKALLDMPQWRLEWSFTTTFHTWMWTFQHSKPVEKTALLSSNHSIKTKNNLVALIPYLHTGEVQNQANLSMIHGFVYKCSSHFCQVITIHFLELLHQMYRLSYDCGMGLKRRWYYWMRW